MRRLAIASLLILTPYYLCAAHLQYLPSVPVQCTSKLTLEIQESLPILNLTTKGNQILKLDMFLKNESTQLPITKLPLSLNVTLKDIFLFLNVNGKELTFDPKGKKVSIALIQLGQLIDKPMQLQIDTHGYLEGSETFATLFKELPALKELSLQLLLNEIFFHQFALCGEELSVGTKIQKIPFAAPYHSLPLMISYEIVKINNQEISAKMHGKLEPKKLLFDVSSTINQDSQKIEMSFSGNLLGDISWNRNNAMIYTLNSSYDYLAEMKFGEMHWNMRLSLSHVTTSTPQ